MRKLIRILCWTLVLCLAAGLVGCQTLPGGKETTETKVSDNYPAPTLEEYTGYGALDCLSMVTLPEYGSLNLTVTITEVTDQTIQNGIQELLSYFNTNQGSEYYVHRYEDESGNPLVLKEHDYVCFDCSAMINGEPFSGGTINYGMIALEENNGYIPGFWNPFLGRSVGETFQFSLAFPEDYLNPDNYPEEAALLNGQTAEWTITVRYVAGDKTDPEELTDELVREFYGAENVESFLAVYRTMMVQSMHDTAYDQARADVLALFVESSSVIRYPENAVEYYVQYLNYQLGLYADDHNISFEKAKEKTGYGEPNAVENYAKDWVKDYLVIYAIIQKENLDEANGFENWVTQKAAEVNVSVLTFLNYYEANYGANYLNQVYLGEIASAFLLEHVVITEQTVSPDSTS